MPAETIHTAQTRRSIFGKPMNARSLEMMVSSGVVRRADCTPTLVSNRREPAVPSVAGRVHSEGASLAQGWLVRLLVRRKSAASL
jgi:hypothetical protein